jgi:hypothetical protein
MDENNLKEGIVVDESHELYNVLNFHDFVMEEGKKEAKKSRPKVKNYEEFTDEMEGDFTDPNDNPERFIKLREQFIEEE